MHDASGDIMTLINFYLVVLFLLRSFIYNITRHNYGAEHFILCLYPYKTDYDSTFSVIYSISTENTAIQIPKKSYLYR